MRHKIVRWRLKNVFLAITKVVFFIMLKHWPLNRFRLGNAQEAEKRILATLKWRRANGIDELLSTDEWELPAKLKEQHKVQLVALKGQIQPVWYIPVGTANFKGKSTST